MWYDLRVTAGNYGEKLIGKDMDEWLKEKWIQFDF